MTEKVLPALSKHPGTLLLNVPTSLITIPDWLEKYGELNGYAPKTEYHVTIIGLDLADTIIGAGKQKRVDELISAYDWRVEFLHHFTELAKLDENGIHRRSIIQMVSVPEIDSFFDELRGILNTSIETPPPHITLFTKNYDKGIGLYSMHDLARFRVKDVLENT